MGTDILFCRIVEVVMDVIISNQDQTVVEKHSQTDPYGGRVVLSPHSWTDHKDL